MLSYTTFQTIHCITQSLMQIYSNKTLGCGITLEVINVHKELFLNLEKVLVLQTLFDYTVLCLIMSKAKKNS